MRTLTPNQQEVYGVLKRFGPLVDNDLISITRHVAHSKQSHSGIRTRRNELVRKRVVRPRGTEKMPSGRTATRYGV